MYLSLLLLLCDSDVCKVMCLLDDVDLKVIGNGYVKQYRCVSYT